MSNLIVGAEWYIASRLRKEGQNLRLADVNPKTDNVDRLDILDRDAVIEYFRDNNIQRVANLVNYVNGKDPEMERKIMVDGLDNILYAAFDSQVTKVVLPITRPVYSQRVWEDPKLTRMCESVTPIRERVSEYRQQWWNIDSIHLPQVFSEDERNPVWSPKKLSELIDYIKGAWNNSDSQPLFSIQAWGISVPYVYIGDVAERLYDILDGEVSWNGKDYYFPGLELTPEKIMKKAEELWYDISSINLESARVTSDFRLPEWVEDMQELDTIHVNTLRELIGFYWLSGPWWWS